MLNAGLLKSKQLLTQEELNNTIATLGHTEAETAKIAASITATTATNAEGVATATVTKAKLAEAVQTGILTKEEGELLAAKLGVVAASKAESASLGGSMILNAIANGVRNVAYGARAAVKEIKALGSGLLGLAAAHPIIAGLTAVISVGAVAIAAIKKHNKKLQEELEKMAEKSEEAKSNIKSLSDEMKSQAKTINEIKDRYAELAQGVDTFNNKNKSLSNEDYEEFLNLTNQLSEVFPQLNIGIDDNGNAILNLNGNVKAITSSIESLLEVEQALAQQKITEELDSYIENTLPLLSEDTGNLSKQQSNFEKNKDILNNLIEILNQEDFNNSGYSVWFNPDNFKQWYDIKTFLNDFGLNTNEFEDIYDETGKWVSSIWEFTPEQANTIKNWYGNYVKTTEQEIKNAENSIQKKNSESSAMLSYWLTEQFSNYDNIADNKELQNAVSQVFSNIKWNEIDFDTNGNGEVTKEEVYQWISNNIITPINTATPEVQEALVKLLSGENMTLGEIQGLYNMVAEAFKNTPISINFSVGNVSNVKGQLRKMMGYNHNVGSEEKNAQIDQFINGLSTDESNLIMNNLDYVYDYTQKHNKELFEMSENEFQMFIKNLQKIAVENQMQTSASFNELLSSSALTDTREKLIELSQLGIISEENISGLEGYNELLEQCEGDVDALIKKVKEYAEQSGSTFGTINSLDTIQGGLDSLSKVYADKMDGDDFVQSDLLSGLYEQFGDLSYFDEFIDKMMEVKDVTGDNQEVFDNLATQFIDTKYNMANLTEENAKYVAENLKKLGVENAEEAVNQRLIAVEEQRQNILSLLSSTEEASAIAKQFHIETSEDLAKATSNELVELAKEIEIAGLDASSLRILALQKQGVNAAVIDTTTDINQLLELANVAGVSASTLSLLEAAKNGHISSAEAVGNIVNSAKDQIKAALSNFDIGYNYKYTGGASTYSGGGSGGGNSKSEESKTQIDWIARHLEQLQKKIDRTKAKFENLFSLKNKSSNLDKQIKQTTALMKAQGKAADKYLAKAKEYAESSKLSTDLQKSVQNGRLNNYSLSDLIAEYGQDTADKINQYQDYWDKYKSAMQKENELITEIRNLKEQKYQLYVDQATANLDRITAQAANAKDNYTTQNKYLGYQTKWIKQQYDYEIKIAKLTKDKTKVKQLEAEKEEALAQLEVSKFENISASYDHRIQKLTETMDKAGREIDQLEAAGKNVQASLYKSQRNTANSELKTYQEELKELEKQLKKIKEGTNEWYDAKSSIESVKDAISKTTTTVYELNNAINELHFQLFEDKRTQISRIAQEYEFMLGLAGDLKKVDEDTTQFTDMGYAELGVNSTDYYASLHNQNLDKQTLDELKSMLAKGILSNGNYAFNSVDDLRDKIDDLYDTWQSDIKTTYNYEKSLADAVSQKYQAQLNLAQKLTDERKEALQAEKNLHDYQRTISSQVKEINTLQMQISAYQGDTSQEGMAKLQALQKSLFEAQDELRETEYDRYISDQEDMLSSLYTEYEELISKKLDDFYGLVEEGLKIANEHSADIANALTDIKNTNQYTPQFNSIVTAISNGQSIQQAVSTDVNNILNVLTSSSGLEKIQGFSKGGVISSIEQQVKANGDSVLVSAQPGERILTRVQNENFEKLINSDLIKNPIMLTNMPDFSQYTKVSDFAKSGMGGGNVAININSIDLPNVINPENFGDELANQLQNNKKIQKLTQGITYNGMLGKSTNNVRHIH